MKGSMFLGKPFGIPVFVHATFILLPAWVAYSQRRERPGDILFSVIVVLCVFGCVLLHELGHALMARYFGIRTKDITLYPIGGMARLESTGEKPGEELAIALAGPAVNLAIGAFLLPFVVWAWSAGHLSPELARLDWALGPWGVASSFVRWICLSNFILLFFNLLPAFPMDGGRVLRALLSTAVSRLRATELAVALGVVMAVGFGLLAALTEGPMLLVIGLFVVFAGQQELRGLRYLESRRRREESARFDQSVQEVPELVAARPQDAHIPGGLPVGFTGVHWDRDLRVWVRWFDGRPVEILG
jgi:Zn-dependent protease